MFDRQGFAVTGPSVLSPFRQVVAHLSPEEKMDALRAAQARVCQAQAELCDVIAEIHAVPDLEPRAECDPDRRPFTREELTEAEVAACLHWTPAQAARQVRAALTYAIFLPATLDALRCGHLDSERAALIARRLQPMIEHTRAGILNGGGSPRQADDTATAQTTAIEGALLPWAHDKNTEQIAAKLRTLMLKTAAGFMHRERVTAEQGRCVSLLINAPSDDTGQDMSDIYAHLPAIEARAVHTTLDGYARVMRRHGDQRTLDQLRADVLTHLILRGHPPLSRRPGDLELDRYGIRTHVQITVSLDTLLGLNDHPAHLHGHGSIEAQQARELAFAAGGTWQRLVTDPLTGQLIDYGAARYQPDTAITRHVRTRDQTCRTPGCRRPAERCDLDHVVPYPRGHTNTGNLQAKCRYCHRLKHEAGWHHEPSTHPDHPPGTIKITSPLGQTYYTSPAELGDIRTPPPPNAPPTSTTKPDYGAPPF